MRPSAMRFRQVADDGSRLAEAEIRLAERGHLVPWIDEEKFRTQVLTSTEPDMAHGDGDAGLEREPMHGTAWF